MTFETTFNRLAAARLRYEDLRRAGAPPADLVEARVGLLHLRAEMAKARRGMI